MTDLAEIMGQYEPHPRSSKETVVLYRSKVDGVNRGIRRSDFDAESWNKAMQTIMGLDTAMWMFGSEASAKQFDPGMVALYDDKKKGETNPLTPAIT
jgi:hypothetical protein